MAKSLRSSRNKANKSKLRSNVFGPAEIARKERLSAKIIELASKLQSNREEGMKMADGEKGRRLSEMWPRATDISNSRLLVTTHEIPEEAEAHIPGTEDGRRSLVMTAFVARRVNTSLYITGMDIDQAKQPSSTTQSTSRSTSRVQKPGRGKARAAMVFPIYRKGKRVGPRLSARETKKSLRP